LNRQQHPAIDRLAQLSTDCELWLCGFRSEINSPQCRLDVFDTPAFSLATIRSLPVKKSFAFVAGIIAVSGLAFTMLSSPVTAQKKGQSRPMTTAQLMSGLVKPQLVAVQGHVADEKAPEGEDGWKALTTSIALLNESSYTMMDDDRCPDKIWADACQVLRKATESGLKSAAKQDAAGVREALAGIGASCKACHAEHKYKKQ
jgi:cytochrome c556